jgi:hypothetical protein
VRRARPRRSAARRLKTQRTWSAALAAFLFASVYLGCGKKGPPLPPLLQFPAPPADLVASRRGSAVDIQFAVPSANTDGSRPADITRVDVYGFTGAPDAGEEEIVRRGEKVGSVVVNPPPDPDAGDKPTDADSPAKRPPPGSDQGATVHVKDELDMGALSREGLARSYVGVGVNRRGRRGPFSKRAAVLVAAAPAPPSAPRVNYDETRITVAWALLPSPAGSSPLAYHVYEKDAEGERRLTSAAVTDPQFVDQRIEWGAERCYTVRSVETADGLSVESDASPPTCVTLTDTFPPAAPTGLQAVGSEGAISLIWDANNEHDLAGYLVLRAIAPSAALAPITPSPIDASTFDDTLKSGVRAIYAVQAVDKAGNVSPPSNRVEETAR